VGRLSKEKGIRTLLAAWRMLADPPPLDIVGDGPLEGVVREAAAERGTVHWWGRLPLAEVVARMGRSKALVFPSEWYETFGRVGAEAMATGTPVLAARIGALEEMVTPGRDGFFFTPGDAADLAAGVRRMMAAPEGALRSGARRTFEERYTEARNYDLLMDVYRRARAVREERQR
jgi:glycosyltransferase involved in cell wall biosynthesis